MRVRGVAILLAGSLWLATSSWAALPPFPGPFGPKPPKGPPDGSAECPPFLHMEKDLALACAADLDALGLSPAARAELEEKRFQLRAKVIRGQAELRVLELEFGRLTAVRAFDPSAAKKKLSEIVNKQEQLKQAHLAFVADLAAALTDAQWETLRTPAPPPAPPMPPRHPGCGHSANLPSGHPAVGPGCRPPSSEENR